MLSEHTVQRLVSFRALVVDLDGTLADTEPLHKRSYELILSAIVSRDITLSFDDIVARPGQTIWRDLIRTYHLDIDPVRLNRLRKVVLAGLLSTSVPSANDDVLQIIRRSRGIKVLLTTQEAKSALSIVEALGLTGEFDEVISTHDLGADTSKLSVIRALASKYQIGLSDIAWVEDASPELAAGKDAGIFVVVVRRTYNERSLAVADLVL